MVKILKRDTRFWPVDKLILAYFCLISALLIVWWSRIPSAAPLLAWHIAGAALVIFEIKRPNPTTWFFRNWYPLIYVAACYKEMANVLPLARGVDFDQQLADLDQRIWGLQPGVWLARIQTPALDRSRAVDLYGFRARGPVDRLYFLAPKTLWRVPILCFFNQLGIPRILLGICAVAGARTALLT